MTTYKPLRQDPVTQEYYYNNKWYDSYPTEQIEADEAALYEYLEQKRDQKKEEGLKCNN